MSYRIEYDTALAPPRGADIVAFMNDFYNTSDNEALHDRYVQSFTDSATLIMGPKEAQGTDAIRTLRHGLWTHVATRKHTPTRIFFSGVDEIMLYGGVNYRLKASPENDVYVPWAGRVVFDLGQEGIKMKFYQVYLDPSAQSGKK
ncbi:hypothetical protein N7456_012583 [Penicillium angulare]|uniref:SnoaL-like domain-containing protein n=1 Tax=Penicillium angulare TaxID=116970 RepID=A0A9W9EK46_9EURO|nr:hypothetical protein N7456_012583 [Penicillium angulare]